MCAKLFAVLGCATSWQMVRPHSNADHLPKNVSRMQEFRSGLGWSADDHRDILFGGWRRSGSSAKTFGPRMPFNQGRSPCCVSTSLTAAMEILLNRYRGESSSLAPLSHYWWTRGGGRIPDLLTLRGGLAALKEMGVASLDAFPVPAQRHTELTPKLAMVEPGQHAIDDGVSRSLDALGWKYKRVASSASAVVRRWRSALENGNPVIVGLDLPDTYWLLSKSEPRLVRGVSTQEGHAAVAVGFEGDDFEMLDSRGSGFARGGRWYLPSATVRSGTVQESWVIEP